MLLSLYDLKTELMVVTLDKSAARYEGVAYDDYAFRVCASCSSYSICRFSQNCSLVLK